MGGARRRTWVAAVAVVFLGLGFWLGLQDGPSVAVTSGPAADSPKGTAPSSSLQLSSLAQLDDLRGVYVVRHVLRKPETIDTAIAKAVEVGANALFVQVNGRAEAYYSSDVVVGAPDVIPGFDPLAYVLQQARQHNLRVHAWINAYTAGMLIEEPSDPGHVLRRNPQWVTVDRTGRSLWDYAWQEAQVHVPARMLDPGLPQVEDFVVAAVLDVAQNYAVDGIHLDYVRYPSTRFGFHPESAARFEAIHGFDPLALIQEAPTFVARHGRPEFERRVALWDDWRRQRVTDLVARVRGQLRDVGRDVVFSVAVDPDRAEAVSERLQDWPRWVEEGLVDAVVPMAYSPDGAIVVARIAEAVKRTKTGDVRVYGALGAYMVVDAPAVLEEQIKGAMSTGASGTIMFSSDTLVENAPIAETVARQWR